MASLLLSGCTKDPTKLPKETLPTHNKALFEQGRYCHEIKFECLPESRKGDWKNDINTMDEIVRDEALEKQKYLLRKKYEKQRESGMAYAITQEDDEIFDRILMKLMLNEMEVKMEKLYPGFWSDMSRPLRHRWMRLCIAKANRYGYGVKKISPITGKIVQNIRETQQFLHLCGRIGLYFDSDPKWDYITEFIKINKNEATAGTAVDYIDFTVYNKDRSWYGAKITTWLLGPALSYLPYPNRRVPSLSEGED